MKSGSTFLTKRQGSIILVSSMANSSPGLTNTAKIPWNSSSSTNRVKSCRESSSIILVGYPTVSFFVFIRATIIIFWKTSKKRSGSCIQKKSGSAFVRTTRLFGIHVDRHIVLVNVSDAFINPILYYRREMIFVRF